MAEWALDFVARSVRGVIANLESGKHGTGNARQESDCINTENTYSKMTPDQRRTYQTPKMLCAVNNIFPYGYYRQSLRKLKSFKDDKRGEIPAIKALLEDSCASERLLQIAPDKAYAKYRTTQKLYVRKP